MRAITLCCVLAGCYSPAPQEGAPCSANRDCPSGLECSFDNKCVRVASDAPVVPDGCPDDVCMGDTLVTCGQAVACANGCGGEMPHCLQLAPSNGITVDMLMGATADMTQDKLSFDSSDGSIRMMNTVIRDAGTGVIAGIRYEVVNGVAVFTANTWTQLDDSAEWSFTGTLPVILFANLTVDIKATIDVGGSGTTGRLGGSSGNASTSAGGCRGKAGRSNAGVGATFGEGGGGGGGVAAAGGSGGPSNQANPTGAGGTLCVTSPSTIPLRGGNGGGHGGATATNGGGAGGGAIGFVAMESVTISGTVGAPGAGGLTGSPGNGGGGGGGGGAILVEAPVVAITGRLTANGGGGGAPAGGADGTRGSMTTATPALGGALSCVPTPAGTPVTRRGGSGAAGPTNPTNGATCTADDGAGTIVSSQGGGGGGGIGRIEIKRRTGGVSGLASPAAAITDAVLE